MRKPLTAVSWYDCRHGQFCHFSDDQVIRKSLEVYGEWAEQEIYTLSRFIEPGNVIVDAGANIGTHSIAFARMVGASGRVIAIEPQPNVGLLFSANIVANDVVGVVRYIPGALSSDMKIVKTPYFSSHGLENYGAFSLMHVGTGLDHAPMSVPISCFRLDDLELGRCNVIKADVEDFEFQLYNGARHTIFAHRPIVYFEQRSLGSVSDIQALFNELKYDLYWHVTNPHNACNYNGAREVVFGGNLEVNVLGLPRERFSDSDARLEGMTPLNASSFPCRVAEPNPGWMLPTAAYTDLPTPVRARGSL